MSPQCVGGGCESFNQRFNQWKLAVKSIFGCATVGLAFGMAIIEDRSMISGELLVMSLFLVLVVDWCSCREG